MTSALSMMNRRATLYRPTGSQLSSGSPKQVFAVIRQWMPCAIDQATGNEAKRYDKDTSEKLYSGLFLPNAGVNEKDRIMSNGLGTFEVLNVNPVIGMDGATEYLQVDLELTD